jgi:hypothetical protein
MNNEYLFTNEKSRQTISSNLSHNKRYSINITDSNIYKRNDITKINKQDKFYINHAIIPNNYKTKLSNNNYLDNIIKNRNINDDTTSKNFESIENRNDINTRNLKFNKIIHIKNKRKDPKLSEKNNYYNNTFFNNNYNNQFGQIIESENLSKKSIEKDYKIKDLNYRNKNISKLPINNLRSNRQIQSNNINYYKNVINIKHRDKDNQKLNLSNHISNNQNKSMDSNRNNRENNNVNKGNIINLSNLNNAFSYNTDKYSCVYVNKRENSKRYEKDNNNKNINLNLLKYRTSRGKKEKNNIENNIKYNKEQKDPKNIKIKFTKQIYIDTMNNNEGIENNKYLLGINHTQENISHSKEDIDYKIERLKEKKNNNNKESRINREIKEYIPRKNIGNIFIHNSFSNNKERIKRRINTGNNQYVINDRINKNDLSIKNTEQIKDRENERKINNQQENDNNKNVKSIGVGNTNKRKEIKISNEMKNNVDYSMIHNQFSFNSIKKTNKKSNILKIKSNNKLTILNIIRKNEPNKNESNKNDKKKVYKISSNVANEQYYGNNFIEEKKNNDEEDILSISIQSLNDSKIMEIAKRCIEEEDDLNKNEIKEILNCKKDRLL